MSERKVEVKKLVLSVRGKEIALTPDEARELWHVLNAMYAQGATYVPYPVPTWPPPYYWHVGQLDGVVYCTSLTDTTELPGGVA